MSILDSFVFLFRADTRDATRGIDELGNAFDDAREDGQNAADDLGDSFGEFGHKMQTISAKVKEALTGSLSGGFAALGAALGVATVSALGLNEALERIPILFQRVQDAATVGVDIEQYDAMTRVFEQNGVEADAFRDSMIDLNEAMGEAAADAKSGKAESFKTFGISLKNAKGEAKDASQVMLELSDSLSKMDKQQATFQIKQLGITDNAVIAALLLGNKALKEQIELQKQKFALTDKDKEQLIAYTHEQKMLQATIDGIVDQIAVMLLPALTKLTEGFRVGVEWVIEHKRVIAIAAGVIATAMIPTIARATVATAQWAVATLAATWPFLAIAAAIAAVIIVIDDLWAYYEGGGSVIGEFAEKHEMLKDVLEGLRTMAKGLMQFFSDMWNNPEKALQDFSDFMQKVWDNMVADTKMVFTELWNWLVNLFSSIGTKLKNSIVEAIKEVPGGEQVLSLVGIDTSTPAEQNETKAGQPVEGKPGVVYGSNIQQDIPGAEPAKPQVRQEGQPARQPEVKPVERPEQKPMNTPGGRDMMIPGDNPVIEPEQHAQAARRKHKSLEADDVVMPNATGTQAAVAATTIVNQAAASPVIPPPGRNVTVSNQNQQHIDKVEVNVPSGNPQEVRTAVADGLNDHLKSTAQSWNDGVSH